MSFPNPRYELRSNPTQTPNKYHYSSLGQRRQSVNDQNSLSYSHTNKNTHKYLSYDSETGDINKLINQPNIIQQVLEQKYDNQIGDDLSRLNSKLQELQNCFLNMSTINHQNKQNIRPGMLKKSNKNSRQNSKQVFVTKRNSLIDNYKNSYESTKRVSRKGSFIIERSDIKEVSKQKEISELKRQVSFCQKSLSASRHKKQILERRVDDCNQKIKNYKILQRKAKKMEIDYAKIVRTLEKSEQVRLKQKSLIFKYQQQIKRLNKMVKFQK